MARYVVDASVAAKWFVAEPHSEIALTLVTGPHDLVAPSFILAELGSVFLKKVSSGDMSVETAMRNFRTVEAGMELIWTMEQQDAAFVLARRYNRSFYDSLYVALAVAEGCQLVTADERLYNALAPEVAGTMLWIADLP